MNAFICNDCGRIWNDQEVVTIRAKTTQGELVEIHFCPMSRCDGKAQPMMAMTDRRRSERQVA